MTPEQVAGGAAMGVAALVIKRLFQRIDKLELRLDKAEAAIMQEAEKRNRVERLLERVCTGYESVRRELLKVARILRRGETVSEAQLAEIEATPDIKELLKNPFESH
jgi:hypothetical protein